MKRYERPEMRVTFVKNTDIINASTVNAVAQLGKSFESSGVKYRTIIFK